jgi:uncharacterized repeat protein (TIGR01451 family)
MDYRIPLYVKKEAAMKSPIHCKRIIESHRALMTALVVIMLCNLLPLGRSVAAIGKRETVAPSSPAGFAAPPAPDQPTTARLSVAHSKLPIMFEANLGQTDPQVKFLSRGAGYTIFLTPTEAVVLLSRGQLIDSKARSRMRRPTNSVPDTTQAVLRMKLAGGAGEPHVIGLEELRGKSNYFIGSDPEKWRTDVPLYARVQYKAIYPGIDLVYYGNQGELEYDFVVGAGADPAQIRLSFDGAQKIRTDANGDLVLKTPGGEVRQRKPHVYQQVEGVKKEVKGRYVLKGRREVGFALAGYDREKPLIIDPVLSYATYLGGDLDDAAQGIAVDSNGYAYVTGYTYSINFPVKNAFQSNLTRYYWTVPDWEPRKGQDAFITKFDPSKAGADSLVYSTFLGGSHEELGHGIAVDSNGNAYVTGLTKSMDKAGTDEHEAEFPVVNAFQEHLNPGDNADNPCYNSDAFVTKLSAAGNALLYSTYFGGGGEDKGYAIAVDSFGNAYVAGVTYGGCDSLPGSKFFLRDPFEPSYPGDQNGFVAKFNTFASGDASLIFSTMLGGGPNRGDTCYGIAVTPSGGNIYVTGSTIALNFPTKNAYQPQKSNGEDAFLTVFNDTRPLSLLYSTYLGGTGASGNSSGAAIAIDSSGNAYVTGLGAYPFRTRNPVPGTLATGPFVSKINPFLVGDASLIYSTGLAAGFASQQGKAIAVDADGYAYVTGFVDRPGGILTKDPIQPYGGGNYDAFVAKLSPAGNDLVYSTYLGGSGVEQGLGIATDVAGNTYVAGFTHSINFPTTPGAYCGTKPPSISSLYTMDAFMAKLTDKRADLVITTTASPDPVVTGSNLTYTITVTNLGPDPARTVIVTDDLAPEVGFVSSTPATTGSYDSRMIRFDSLAAGASVSITIDAMVSCFASDGTIITNTATVTSLTIDPDTGNNSASLETIASNPPPEITCPADIVTTSPIVNYRMPTVVDNCLGLMMTRCSPPSGSTFPVGTTEVICVISDAGGNGSRCSFSVTVRGN